MRGVARDQARAVKHRKGAVRVLMDADPRLDEMRAQPALGQLQLEPAEAHGVVAADHALLLHAQRLAKQRLVRHRDEAVSGKAAGLAKRAL